MSKPVQIGGFVEPDMRAKFLRLGGSAWLRNAIKRAPEPLFPKVKVNSSWVGSDTRPRKEVARRNGLTLNQVDYARRIHRAATGPRY